MVADNAEWRSSSWMEPSDSPSFVRIPLAATRTAVSTCSFSFASTCSRARVSPVAQLVAWRMIAYDVPRPAMEPRIIAFSRPRSQTSRATSLVIRSPGRTLHQPENLSDLQVGHDFQKGRSFELESQRLTERAVKDGVSRAVGEIGEDQDIFVGERRGLRTPLPEKRSARGQQRDDDHHLVEWPAESCRDEWRSRGRHADTRQGGFDLGGGGPPGRILVQHRENEAVERRGDLRVELRRRRRILRDDGV